MNQNSSTHPVRFAYVGCGFVAQQIHIPNFAASPECDFVALAEARPELGGRVAARYDIPQVCESHHEIADDPSIEAVGVSGPYALQGAIAQELLLAGKHVFVEKPMAVSLARAHSIVEAQKQSGKRLMVGYMKRYDAGNLRLKAHLDEWRASDKMGRVLLARNHGFGGDWLWGQDPNVPLETSGAPAPPAPDECPDWLPEAFKGRYLNYLQQWTHNINLLRFLLETQPGETRVESVQLDEDGMTGLVTLDIGGVRSVIESGYTRFHGWDEHTQIYLEGGWLKTAAPPLLLKETPATVEIYRAAHEGVPASLEQKFAPASWSYREEARHFLQCVRGDAPFRSSADDTLHDVRLFEEIYRKFVAQSGTR